MTLVATSSSDTVVQLSVLSAGAAPRTSADAESQTLALFDQSAPRLLRYVASFGFGIEESEDLVQEAFLALFRHLSLGRDQTNLAGWLFRVAHNLALKRRRAIGRRPVLCAWDDALARRHVDPAPNPEAQVVQGERRRRLRSIVAALPDRERRCLFLRAEGLTYRDIATTLGVSLGTVAKSLTRAMTRLVLAGGG